MPGTSGRPGVRRSNRAGLIGAAFAIAVAAAWLWIYLVVPGWVAQDPVTRMGRLGLVGRKMNYEAFLHYWPRYHLAALLLVGAIVMLTLVASTPLAQRGIVRLFGPEPVLSSSTLGSRRLKVVGALWLAILGPQLLAGISGLEAWPFSPYGMYAARQGSSVSFPRIRIETSEGPVDMRDPAWLSPFDLSRLDFAIGRLIRQGDSTALAGAAHFALRRYNAARTGTSAHLPPATGVHIFRDSWVLQEGAVNRDRPDSSEVVYSQAGHP